LKRLLERGLWRGAFGEGPNVAVAGEKVRGFLLVVGEEPGGDDGDGHDLGGRESGLRVVSMVEGF
jgi:hypothetical protein